MLALLVLVLGATAILLRTGSGNPRNSERLADAAVLAEAKRALLAYAVTSFDLSGRHGLLPCPDIDAGGGFAEGVAHDTACSGSDDSVLGRLPWRTLGLPPLRDAAGQCLWYALSADYRDSTPAAPMVNADSNGRLRIFAADGNTVEAGAVPAERAVAVILAPGAPLQGQVRASLAAGVERCGGHYGASDYLDSDGSFDHAALASPGSGLFDFRHRREDEPAFNDRLVYITRSEIAAAVARRADARSTIDNLTRTVAECVANHGLTNPGGAGDRRLPWPAPLALADYRSDALYDDGGAGALSGRLADVVDNSNAWTGNPRGNMLLGCDPLAVPGWTPAMAQLWRDHKDHLFIAMAGAFAPDAATPSTCGACLTVNGTGPWAAVILYAGVRLPGQVRDMPPLDPDTRNAIDNYVEGRNASNHPNAGGNADYQSGVAGPTFNDLLYCIDPAMTVSAC